MTDVEGWRQTVSPEDSENDERIEDWRQTASRRLLQSSLKVRIACLNELAHQATRADPSDRQIILKCLLKTVALYVDGDSRKAVLSVLRKTIGRAFDESTTGAESFPALLRWTQAESSRLNDSLSPTSRYNLVCWICEIYSVAAKRMSGFTEAPAFATLTNALSASLSSASTLRPAIHRGCLIAARTTVRQNAATIPALLALLTKGGQREAVALGLVIDVAIRLKQRDGKPLVREQKDAILRFYVTNILSAKPTPPDFALNAFRDFIEHFVTLADIESHIQPALEKLLIRQPEAVLPAATASFESTKLQLDALLAKLTPQIGTNARSTSATTRSAAVACFIALVRRCSEGAIRGAATELAAPIKSGRPASAENRATLFAMLAACSPDASIAQLALTSKEASAESSAALTRHLVAAIESDSALDLKAARKGVLPAIGDALWALDRSRVSAEKVAAFYASLVPLLDSALKNATTVPIDALVAIALAKCKDSIARGKDFDAFAADNAGLQNLLATGLKPSVLLNDKVYRKLSSTAEDTWFLRALVSTIESEEAAIQQSARVASAIAQPLIYAAVEAPRHEMRIEALAMLQRLTGRAPELSYALVCNGLQDCLLAAEKRPRDPENDTFAAHSSRLRLLLATLTKFSAEVTREARQQYLARLLVLAHHPRLALAKSSLWIELVLAGDVKPDELVSTHSDQCLRLIAAHGPPIPASEEFAEAAARALTDLVIIAPQLILPLLVRQIVAELDAAPFRKLTEQDFAIWQASGDVPVIDVLALQKKSNGVMTNGKDAALAKWDAEQRQALAKKKGSTPQTLSKADRAVVDAQLAKESDIRSRIAMQVGTATMGLRHLQSLLAAHQISIDPNAAAVVQALLTLSQSPVSPYIAEALIETFARLGTVCLGGHPDLVVSLSAANLRIVDSQAVPEDLLGEAFGSLVMRVLYKLRSVSETKTVTPAFYCFASPLLSAVITRGSIGVPAEENEAKLEQLQLATDFIAAQCSLASNEAFPRLQMMADLIAVLSAYPQLSKTATTGLLTLGEAIQDNASRLEIDALLVGAMVEEAHVRSACLQALQPLDLTDRETSVELWLLCQDEDERNKKLAAAIWEENGLDVSDAFIEELLPYLGHASAVIRKCAAQALSAAARLHPHRVADVLQRLVTEYDAQSKEMIPEYDRFGMIVEASLNREDPWRTRVAVAAAVTELAELLDSAGVDTVFNLLIVHRALADRHADVRSKMLGAGNAVIDLHGKANLQKLIGTFEVSLRQTTAQPSGSDQITEAVIILFGRLAKHLEAGDPRIQAVIKRLNDALSTPSEDVQIAVSECLPPLIKLSKEQAPDIIDSLLRETLRASKYAERRGSAYGLAGAVKGRGIGALKEFDIIGRIKDAIEDKKDSTGRQGAVFAIETLSSALGRIFEPYIIQVLPLLLQTFGDSVVEVRNATQDAAKAIMSKISGHAVKLILPSLLAGLEDRQWRSKKGAIELIGTMAFLAPRQLSLSLPTILPRLTEVLTDTHAQVRAAANASLKQFGEVITNPEIQAMQSTLLDALIDPTRKTIKALETLLATTFAHFIDNSSLALVVPILERGIRDRSSEVKRKAAQIVGTLATITEARDLSPYLPQLVPKVREVLVDPVPEARATAAQALGGLVERLGEDAFPDLLNSLLETLSSETTGIDQQGAAQGLAEILAGLGTERLEEMLPDIIAQTRSSRAYVREGFVSLLVFLPLTYGDRFAPYLARIIEPVLGGLADESDYVREASLKAGRMIVSTHSNKAVTLLLPELEKGLFDRNHRIRHSSMQLVGELLFKVTGISGKAELAATEEDEEDVQAAVVKVSLVDALGRDRRDRVLAAMFIVRQDSSGPVRQLAVNVWKALVPNTPRTVREVLATLIQIIVKQLAAQGADQRECAARALGDLCRKMGESVLADLMPVLHRGSAADDRTRQGVQLALTEILAACSDAQIEAHENAIVGSIRTALVDPSSVVRAAAAQAFDTLQQSIGPRAIDMTVPVLLETLRHPGPSADAALAALQEVMSVRADKIVPVLIPTLIKTPITAFNGRALAALVGVAGNALSRRLSSILDALEDTRVMSKDDEVLEEVQNATKAVLASIKDDESLSLVEMHLLSLAKDASAARRAGACNMLAILSFEIHLDMSDYYVDWVRLLISLFDDRDPEVMQAAWNAMNVFVSRIPKDDLENLAPALRRSIETTGTAGVNLPGFELGLKPIMPILLQGLLAGTAEQREQAAYAMGDIVERISLDALKPYVTQMAGPLIRIIAERFPAPVRAAILQALTILVGRVPTARPFYPQIQRTFSKSVADPTSVVVRSRGAAGLGVLMAFQPRIDPLLTELLTGATTSEMGEVRESFLDAIAKSVQSGGKNMTSTSQTAVMNLVSKAFDNATTMRESHSAGIARVFAAMLSHFSSLLRPLIESDLVNPGPATQLASFCLHDAIERSPQALYDLGISASIASAVVRTAQIVDNPAIARPARQARDLLRLTPPFCDDSDVQDRL